LSLLLLLQKVLGFLGLLILGLVYLSLADRDIANTDALRLSPVEFASQIKPRFRGVDPGGFF